MLKTLKELALAGVTEGDKRDLRVACVTTNVALFVILISSFAWAAFVKSSLNNDFLFHFDLALGMTAVFLYVAMLLGKRDFARFGVIVLVSVYYILLNLAVGLGGGTEFWAVPMCFLPLLVFPHHEERKSIAGMMIAVTSVIGALVAMSFVDPILKLPAEFVGQAYIATVVSVVLASLAIVTAFKVQVNYLTTALEVEKDRAKALLSNILPDLIAARLAKSDARIADSHGGATVLFADLVGFTVLTRKLAPAQLVDMLDELVGRLDKIATAYGVEKIKTIGDCYMAACGVLGHENEDPSTMVEFAKALIQDVNTFSETTGYSLAMRVGIGYGQLISGVIGTSKKTYDLWGETVNLASRMESTGESGRIQVTESVYFRLHDRYEFEKREKVQVKGVGLMTTYFLV